MSKSKAANSDGSTVSGNDLWVVLLSASRYYFNYRHFANTVAIYSIVKTLGVNDDHIILLDASDLMNEYRNIYRGEVYFESSNLFAEKRNLFRYSHNNKSSTPILLPGSTNYEIDYHGEEVNIDLISHLFLHDLPLTPQSRILFYMTGHGGNEFFKFHDFEEFNTPYLKSLFMELYLRNRFSELFFLVDTCQASTIVQDLLTEIPNLLIMASSRLDESSYSYYPHQDFNIPIIDRFTYQIYSFFHKNYLQFLEKEKALPATSLSLKITDLFSSIDKNFIYSTPYLEQSKEWTYSETEQELIGEQKEPQRRKQKKTKEMKNLKKFSILSFFGDPHYLQSYSSFSSSVEELESSSPRHLWNMSFPSDHYRNSRAHEKDLHISLSPMNSGLSSSSRHLQLKGEPKQQHHQKFQILLDHAAPFYFMIVVLFVWHLFFKIVN
jgi:glycosylphosphatidylinositol transamidase (GPIT) subunit GPI8